VKSLIRIENHLRGFLRNSSIIADSTHVQQWNSCVRKHLVLALLQRIYGGVTVRTLIQLIRGCMQQRVYKKPNDLAQLKQRLVEVWANFEQIIVNRRATAVEEATETITRTAL